MGMDEYIDKLKNIRDEREIKEHGRVLTDHERKEIEEEEERIAHEKSRREKIERNLREFIDETPKRFKGASFSSFICSSDKQRTVVSFLKEGRSAVIYGSNGVGKTHLAFASCLEQINNGKNAKYILAFDFFNSIRRSFGDYTTDKIIKEYEQYDYLVIDEIDKTQGTPMEFTYLYSLINKRYNEMKSTVLITNAKPSDFASIIGQSALDRVASEGKVIDLTGDNYRQKRIVGV